MLKQKIYRINKTRQDRCFEKAKRDRLKRITDQKFTEKFLGQKRHDVRIGKRAK